ncbi:MAG TPA: YebC/PmpR family DNA-binding transcriptional regulator, partial [Lactobacillus sp.]|nr:YebC/PmpR family DNA-binding transcriptional regulator [Lactobacillus sp.]
TSDEVFEIYTEPKIFEDVRDALQAKYDLDSAEITMVPQNTVPVPEDKVEQLQRLIDRLEDEDDVSEVFTSAEFPDED